MQDWEEWEISALHLVPLSIHTDTGALWQQPGGFWGLKRFPCPTTSLLPPASRLSASSVWGRKSAGYAFDTCSSPLSHPALAGFGGEAPPAPSVVAPWTQHFSYTPMMCWHLHWGTRSWCHQCPCCVQKPALLTSWPCVWDTEGCPQRSWGGHVVETKVRAQMMSWRGETEPTRGMSVCGGYFCLHLPLVMMYL